MDATENRLIHVSLDKEAAAHLVFGMSLAIGLINDPKPLFFLVMAGDRSIRTLAAAFSTSLGPNPHAPETIKKQKSLIDLLQSINSQLDQMEGK